MACILVADYGRDDLLELESPLVLTLRAWGHEVIEAEDRVDVLQQVHAVHPNAVILYDTLPELEQLRTTLHHQGATHGIPILTLHEPAVCGDHRGHPVRRGWLAFRAARPSSGTGRYDRPHS